MIRIVKEFFTYSKSEKRGIIILIGMLIGMIVMRYFVPMQSIGKPIDPDAFYVKADSFISRIEIVSKTQEGPKEYKKPAGRSKLPQSHISMYDTLMLDINRADTFDLQLLRGIGPYFARNIVKYRASLGGFVDKGQLYEVYGMDTLRVAGIIDNIYIDTLAVKKININSASLKQMIRHPYLDFHVVKAILMLRAEKGSINSNEELLGLDEIYEELFRRIEPYLTLQSAKR